MQQRGSISGGVPLTAARESYRSAIVGGSIAMEDDHALNSPADGAMGRRGRRGSIPAPAFTGDKGATAGGRASAGNTGQARADGSPKPALVGANGVAATPKGSERRVLFSDEVQAGAGAATPNLLAQVLASPGKAFGRIFGMGRAEPAKTDLTPEEAKSLADLAERVHDETGLTLTDGWTVSIEQSGGKKTKRRTRFYSPGGRRFSSMSEAVTALRKQQTDADVKTIDGCLPGAAVNDKAVDAELWTSPRAKAKARRFVEEEEDPAPAAAARDKAKTAAKDPTPVMSPRSSGRQTKKPEAFVAESAPSPVELRGTKRVEDEDDDEEDDEEGADDSEEEELVAPTQAAPPREDSDEDADSDEDEEEEAGTVTPAQERVADELDALRARCAEHRELADVDIGDDWNVEWRVRSEGSKGKGKYRKMFVAPDGARRFQSVPEVVEYLKKLVANEEENPGTIRKDLAAALDAEATTPTPHERSPADDEQIATEIEKLREYAAANDPEVPLPDLAGWTCEFRQSNAKDGRVRRMYVPPGGAPRQLDSPGKAFEYIVQMSTQQREASPGADKENAGRRSPNKVSAAEKAAAEKMATPGAPPGHPGAAAATKALDALRRKVEMKLDHELEEGWTVDWEISASSGKSEKVYTDPDGVKLWGDGQALTHVKLMLEERRVEDKRKALELLQAELAADEAQLQAKREEENRKIQTQLEEEERKILEMERANAEAAAKAAEEVRRTEREKQAEVEKLRAELQRKREAAARASGVLALPMVPHTQRTPAPALAAPGALPALPAPPRRTPTKGKSKGGSKNASRDSPNAHDELELVAVSPARNRSSPRGVQFAHGVSNVLSPRTATTLAVNKASSSPAHGECRFPRRPNETIEESAVRELRERVADETGVVLGEDWTAKVELKTSNGKKGSSAKRRTRFFSPGGRRFSSASEVVGYVQDTLAKKRVGQGLAPGVGPIPRSVERTRRNNADYADDDVDECAEDETVEHAKLAFLQHVREETGVQLTASKWRVEFESANTSSASKRKRFFAPDGRKFSSQSKVVQMLANPGFSYRKLDPSAKRVGEPTPKSTVGKTPSHLARAKVRVGVTPRTAARLHVHPRGEDDPLSPDMPLDVDELERTNNALKELNSKVKAELGIKMTPGWTVRREKTGSGKTYNRFYNADGKRFSSHADIITYIKKQLNVEDDTEGPRNLAAAMELAAGEGDKDAGSKAATRRSARATAGARKGSPEQAPKKRPARAAAKPPAASDKSVAPAKKSVTLPKSTGGTKTAATTMKKSSPSNSLATPALAKAAPPRVPTPTTGGTALEKEALKTFYDVIREEFPSITIQGWRVEIKERKTGNSQGTKDKYFYAPPLSKSAPDGMHSLPTRFRSMNEVMSYVKVRYLGEGVDVIRRGKKSSKAPKPSWEGARASKASRQTAGGAKRTRRGGTSSEAPAAKRARPARGGKTAAVEVEADDDEDEESASESDSESESESGSESGSESESDEDDEDNNVTVEGMVTVEERQAGALGREPENKPLTPAKASELAEEVENCIEDPEMGFDVDVLLLLHQKVTGFEADCDDALELREMIQRAVRKKTEEAYAYAVSTGKKKQSRRASHGGHRAISPATAADGARAADVRRRFASAASPAKAASKRRSRREREDEDDEEGERDDARGGTRVAMTLGNVAMNARLGSRLNEDPEPEDLSDDETMEIADGDAAATANVNSIGGASAFVEIKTEDDEDEVRLSQNDSSFDAVMEAEPASPEPSLPALGTAAMVWNAADPHMVNQAKQRLHISVMPAGFAKCRERERRKVVDIIQGCLKKRRGGSMYVCGLPGTGKSLTVSQAEKMIRCWGDGTREGGGGKHALPTKERPRVAAVNCMALSEPRHVFARVIEELGGVPPALADVADVSDVTQLPEVAALRQLVCGAVDGNSRGNRNGSGNANQPMMVVLLDEMDQLMAASSKGDQAILYELFGLPTIPGSRCVVVGVANAINLVEVTLPRLAARGCEPTVVSFNAYDKDQLQRLLKQRLTDLPFAVFEDAGLELVARKVAAATGDMRRALNICTTAIDICAGEAAQAAEEGGVDVAGEDAFKLVKIHHVARAISASFNSPVVETMRGLPQHQQMVLCAAVRLFRAAARKETTLGVLNDQYTKLCKEAKLRGLTVGEFSGVCTVLADQTLLKLGAGREDRQRKVSLGVHNDDVVFALQGVNFFRNLIGELNRGV